MGVLREFYAKAGEATAFSQVSAAARDPTIFETKYTGMQSENGGVVGMLEVIQSDFSRLEADTRTAEATSAKEYKDFVAASEADKAEKETAVEDKTAKKQDTTQDLQLTEADLAAGQKELDAALQYFEKLKPSCIDVGVSYEDRVARRKEELESLQEALKILNGEDIAF